ncbi:uncharacterized protein METZ01_LOCUS155513, partial [marine metagenome]
VTRISFRDELYAVIIASGFPLIRNRLNDLKTGSFVVRPLGFIDSTRKYRILTHTMSSNVGGYHPITIIVIFVMVLLIDALLLRSALILIWQLVSMLLFNKEHQ